ncbi:MAG TPA: Rrf2 family transcriptional regulator [Microthrixaceae bacterium]|jgi:Rrf2 family iron-sulfur cluster assembly transcriptional regulator|nr:Rrf2 family transcriptional regulator [Microthrixaceae bacterium]
MRLEVTRKSDLAVKTLVALSRTEGRLKASALADETGATPGFMPQVVSPLVRKGWVSSDPGPTGGYALQVPPEEISVLDVIEAIEGPTDTTHCVLADRPCGETGFCSLHGPWSSARDLLLGGLASVSVADVRDGLVLQPRSSAN